MNVQRRLTEDDDRQRGLVAQQGTADRRMPHDAETAHHHVPDAEHTEDDREAERAGSKSSIFSALRYRNYRLFWGGQLVSVTGTFMQGTAQQWLVLTLTSNPIALGIVGALQFGPLLVPFGGAIADRFPRRRVLIGTQAVAGILAVALGALTITHTVQLWHVYVLSFLLGIVNAVDLPTRQAFVSEMVPRSSLLNAISLNSAQFNVSRILGPGLAGALIALFGVPPLFLVNAVSFIAVIIGLALMRTSELVPVPHGATHRGMRAVGDGIRFVWSDQTIRVTFLLVAVVGTLGFNFNVVLPLEAKHVLHAGPQVFGMLSSALGVGALCGALLLAKRGGAPSNTWLVCTAIAFGLLEASIALAPSIPVTLGLIALTGFAMTSFAASANTRVQLASPPELRGRVMSAYTMVFVGTTPIGNLLVSGVASTGSVPLAFVVSGVPCALMAVYAGWLWHQQSVRRTLGAVGQTASLDTSAALAAAPEVARSPLAPSSVVPLLAVQRAPGQPKLQPRAADPD